jgi:cytochrome c oxidase assembly protein subunit 15
MEFVMYFYRLSVVTFVLVFCVILAGAVVRTTGSGMGCPDWPKCFGQYIPPTDIGQLPLDYKTAFAVKGKQIADFNAFKTWVEYINRLLGVLLGGVILLLVIESRKQWRYDKWLSVFSIMIFLVTAFVGWLGSVVVATDLEPVKITIHMMTSVIIVFLATIILYRAGNARNKTRTISTQISLIQKALVDHKKMQTLLISALLLTLTQVVMGTQIREQVDVIAKMLEGRWREQWIGQLSSIFVVHRSTSWLFVLLNGVIIWYIVKIVGVSDAIEAIRLRRLSMGLGTLILGEIIAGVVMANFAIPKLVQPIHLLLAMGITSLQCLLCLIVLSAIKSNRTAEPLI